MSSVSLRPMWSLCLISCHPAVAGDSSRGYLPGSPGAAWTEEEVRVVQEKVELANMSTIFVSQVSPQTSSLF